MILFIEYPNQDRQHFILSSVEDLQPLFLMFPNTKDIMMHSHSFKEAVDSIVEYLNSGYLDAWIEQEDIMKSLRSKALALGLAVSTSLVPTAVQHAKPAQKPTLVHREVTREPASTFGLHPMDRFLWNVQQIESSGGKNTEHKTITFGKYKGARAIGRWGLLPSTIQEITTRAKATDSLPDGFDKIHTMTRDQIADHFKKNPETELYFARQLADHVFKRQGGNLSRAAYSWLHGHNLHPQDISKESVSGSDYVDKYHKFDKINPFKKPKHQQMLLKMSVFDVADLKHKLAAWLQRRQEYLTSEPMRTSNYQQDLGRVRDSKLDDIKPTSLMSPTEKLKHNIDSTKRGSK